MDSDRIKGKAEEVKGKVQNAWGKTKDAVRDAVHDAKHHVGKDDDDLDDERKNRGVA